MDIFRLGNDLLTSVNARRACFIQPSAARELEVKLSVHVSISADQRKHHATQKTVVVIVRSDVFKKDRQDVVVDVRLRAFKLQASCLSRGGC